MTLNCALPPLRKKLYAVPGLAAAAGRLNVKHPSAPVSQPVVMTGALVITVLVPASSALIIVLTFLPLDVPFNNFTELSAYTL